MNISIPDPGNFGIETIGTPSFTTYDIVFENRNSGINLVLHFDPSNLQVRGEYEVQGSIITINSNPVTNFEIGQKFYTLIDGANIFCFIQNNTLDNSFCLFAINCPSFIDFSNVLIAPVLVEGVNLFQIFEKASDFELNFDGATNSRQAINFLLNQISPSQIVPLVMVCDSAFPYSTQLALAISLPFLFIFLILFIVFVCLYAEAVSK